MLTTANAQLRLAASIAPSIPFSTWALDRLVEAVRQTEREIGPLGAVAGAEAQRAALQRGSRDARGIRGRPGLRRCCNPARPALFPAVPTAHGRSSARNLAATWESLPPHGESLAWSSPTLSQRGRAPGRLGAGASAALTDGFVWCLNRWSYPSDDGKEGYR
jgi:hypothetical protein